jgi:hypothetical protein
MAHCLYQPNKLPFICSKFEVASSDRATEEGEGAVTLVQHCSKTGTGGIAVHYEVLVKI